MILGLLGGIGSGKSTAAALFAQNGAFVLDADQCARELLLDGEVRQEIRAALGSDLFDDEGQVDRARLADRIFTSAEDREKINGIIHPRVGSLFLKQVAEIRAQHPKRIVVLDIPLLLGSKLRPLCDRLILIRSPLAKRIQRLAGSRGWDEAELRRREACQPSIDEKEAAADYVIENDGSLEELETKIRNFLKDTTNGLGAHHSKAGS